MKKAPTLCDMIIRESLRPHGDVSRAFGVELSQARKFVLDDNASSFLADLAHAAFTPDQGKEAVARSLDQARVLSRLPHQKTWIEYNSRVFRQRTVEAYGKHVSSIEGTGLKIGSRDVFGVHGIDLTSDLDEIVPRIGWFMEPLKTEKFPTVSDDTFVVQTAVDFDGKVALLPYGTAWSTGDTILDNNLTREVCDSEICTGIWGWKSPHVAMDIVNEYKNKETVLKLALEFCGEIRFIWAFLSTLNDIPIGVNKIVPSKGYYSRGNYRKFVEHEVISINLPKGREPRIVARQAVESSRRRAHMVRGHWRRHHWKPGERVWVAEHQRGDALLGFVIHDYAVTHETPKR